MIKREFIVAGTIAQVAKLPPGPPGPRFTGKLTLNEKLDILAGPENSGGLHLVAVRRVRTGEIFQVYYAFITNFCKLPKAAKKS